MCVRPNEHTELSCTLPWLLGPGKTFQKRSVSSPAPVTMVRPSGEMARYSTRSQGLTLVHFSAQRKRFLWDRGAVLRGCSECAQGVLVGIRGC